MATKGGAAMETDIRKGQKVYSSDGQKLGTVKDITGIDGQLYFAIDVSLRPDYWLAGRWIHHSEIVDGEDRLFLDLSRDLLNQYKLPRPA
jgi:hypothetical protein